MFRFHTALLSLVALLTIGACAQSKKNTGSQQTGTAQTGGTKAPGNTYARTPAGELGYESITMSRTPCFGRCPVYTIQVFPDGRAIYTGQKNVPDSGVYEKHIGLAGTHPIFDGFAKYRADTCAERYNVTVSDLPGLSFIIRINGRDKRIANANFGPKFLGELGKLIDEKVKVDNTWKKVSDVVDGR